MELQTPPPRPPKSERVLAVLAALTADTANAENAAVNSVLKMEKNALTPMVTDENCNVWQPPLSWRFPKRMRNAATQPDPPHEIIEMQSFRHESHLDSTRSQEAECQFQQGSLVAQRSFQAIQIESESDAISSVSSITITNAHINNLQRNNDLKIIRSMHESLGHSVCFMAFYMILYMCVLALYIYYFLRYF